MDLVFIGAIVALAALLMGQPCKAKSPVHVTA
jgi:hypothetical protein